MFTDLRPEKLINQGADAIALANGVMRYVDRKGRAADGRLDPRDIMGALANVGAAVIMQCYYDDERAKAAYVWWQVMLKHIQQAEKARRA